MINAMIIDEHDDVIIAIDTIEKGQEISYLKGNEVCTLTALDDIQIYHKIARCDMQKGSTISKYGEHIGVAGCDIKIGQHIHTHNVVERRENLQ